MAHTTQSPADHLITQAAQMTELIARLQDAVDTITSTADPEYATWADVAEHAQLAEQVTSLLDGMDEA